MPTSDQLLAELKTLHPVLIDLSLGRITALLDKLGNPHKRLPPVVHIAGTNGKGSTTAYLKAMFEAAGKRVHVYTSPHLVHFHERISVAGTDGTSVPISEEALVALLTRVAAVNAGGAVTFFEITTAAAFVAFSEVPAFAASALSFPEAPRCAIRGRAPRPEPRGALRLAVAARPPTYRLSDCRGWPAASSA